jgi:HD-GYP domain-containing protein (c-di-GMP phosphodiesterase class II)
MRTIPVDSLKPGMCFDKPVFVDGVNLLVPSGLPLKERDIQRLRSWNVTEVQTEGEVVYEPSQDESRGKQLFALWSLPADTSVVKTYTGATETVRGVLDAVKEAKTVNTRTIDDTVNELFALVRDHRDEVVRLILRAEGNEDDLARSSVNCAVLSTVVGLQLRMPSHRLIHLATGALLHDVGMVRVPVDIREKESNLSEDELQTLRMHPVYSYKVITKELKYPEDIGAIVLQHHERWDGHGYPQRLSADNIAIAARIVSVADAFDAMVSARPYRSPMIGYVAMKNILSDNSRRFDPRILKVFIKSMGIYPIGSIVLLNDSSIGRVVSTHPDAPLRPKLQIIIDRHGKEYPRNGKVVDLTEVKSLFIARAVDPNDLVDT